eukprot:CAMPEP_0113245430 /NCGR_PEP_ID=MMETSP0008_2-20120614/8930_1 /TAXON_ID=97485 /ORGANISM="Prymnesium parvum" /LENGTH=148 /DNA_ID=CAMNT_0000093113 /DNA_START=448 /DNA_END=895 /DNA_ORIENTATION=+ /assembly_acc=CAM_ASM_000153
MSSRSQQHQILLNQSEHEVVESSRQPADEEGDQVLERPAHVKADADTPNDANEDDVVDHVAHAALEQGEVVRVQGDDDMRGELGRAPAHAGSDRVVHRADHIIQRARHHDDVAAEVQRHPPRAKLAADEEVEAQHHHEHVSDAEELMS